MPDTATFAVTTRKHARERGGTYGASLFCALRANPSLLTNSDATSGYASLLSLPV